jgi:hypothetical protein
MGGKMKNSNSDNIQCPLCNGYNVVPILYGYLDFDSCNEHYKAGYVWGGCVIDYEENQGNYYCKDCKKELDIP